MKNSKDDLVFYAGKIYQNIPIMVFTTHKGLRSIVFKKLPEKKLKINPLRLNHDDPLMFGVFNQLEEYFNGSLKTFNVPFDISGTPFQEIVWQEINKIPYGETISYKNLGISVGYKGAFQAVGNAVGANPLPIIIPCHRVLNNGGKLAGYVGGLEIKKKLLEIEGKISLELF